MLFKYIKRVSKKVICLTLSIYLLSSLFIAVRAENYEWTVINNYNVIETNSQAEGESNEQIAKDELNLDCESAILIEQNSGQVLYEKNSHEQLRPASVTKLMSILLIFEALENRSNKTRRSSTLQSKRSLNGGLTNMARHKRNPNSKRNAKSNMHSLSQRLRSSNGRIYLRLRRSFCTKNERKSQTTGNE